MRTSGETRLAALCGLVHRHNVMLPSGISYVATCSREHSGSDQLYGVINRNERGSFITRQYTLKQCLVLFAAPTNTEYPR